LAALFTNSITAPVQGFSDNLATRDHNKKIQELMLPTRPSEKDPSEAWRSGFLANHKMHDGLGTVKGAEEGPHHGKFNALVFQGDQLLTYGEA